MHYKYLSTKTIIEAYNKLKQLRCNNESVLHTFFILRGIGFNNITFRSVDDIASYGLNIASNLSTLFSPGEISPAKFDFINPFHMYEFEQQAPSEPLKKWVRSRIKNNVIGGATTWRNIINYDSINDKMKFSFDYINEVKKITLQSEKINLQAISIWYFRMTAFESTVSEGDLTASFIKGLNLNDTEESTFFDSSLITHLQFENQIHDATEIRKLIGLPKNENNSWFNSNKISSLSGSSLFSNTNINIFKMDTAYTTPSITKVFSVLLDNYQIILSGPPGTSKSYLANKIAEKIINENSIEHVLKIQFHPQYSYQDFIGGFIVDGDKVKENEGVLLDFLKKVKQSSAPFLLIIDEINRTNVSKVFGEVVQCLDRDYSTILKFCGKDISISLPKNLLIVATMNTADRTLGSMDFALKRRFANIYCPVNETELMSTCTMEDGFPLTDLLKKVNRHLKSALKNNELVIGQALFYNQNYFDATTNKYSWNFQKLEDLFNFKILPIVEDYSNGDDSKTEEVLGSNLLNRLTGSEFKTAIQSYITA